MTLLYVQDACDYFTVKLGRTVVLDINSGCRCFEHNVCCNGSWESKHLQARAIDHSIRGISIAELAKYYILRFKGEMGIGLYDTFIHFDSRTDGPARW